MTRYLFVKAAVVAVSCMLLTGAFVRPALAEERKVTKPQKKEESAVRSAKQLLDQGNVLIGEGKKKEGIAHFRLAVHAFGSERTKIKVAEALANHGQAAEAIEVYEEYLAHTKVKARVRKKIEGELLLLKEQVGRIKAYVEPKGVAVQVQGRKIELSGRYPAEFYLEAGENVLSFSRAGYRSQIRQINVMAGEMQELELKLTKLESDVESSEEEEIDFSKVEVRKPERKRVRRRVSRQERMPWEIPIREEGLGALLGVHADVKAKGMAGFVGISYGSLGWLDIILGGILGKEPGAYVGGRVFLMEEKIAPVVSLGSTVFFVDGFDVGARGGVGVSFAPFAKLWVVAEVAAEYYFQDSDTYERLLWVPSLAIEGRL